uniref:Uncharacterized protein n=1 Tax=Steinernema glaseri TaxID=37863 RepID=A0A1I8A4J7_9BILA
MASPALGSGDVRLGDLHIAMKPTRNSKSVSRLDPGAWMCGICNPKSGNPQSEFHCCDLSEIESEFLDQVKFDFSPHTASDHHCFRGNHGSTNFQSQQKIFGRCFGSSVTPRSSASWKTRVEVPPEIHADQVDPALDARHEDDEGFGEDKEDTRQLSHRSPSTVEAPTSVFQKLKRRLSHRPSAYCAIASLGRFSPIFDNKKFLASSEPNDESRRLPGYLSAAQRRPGPLVHIAGQQRYGDFDLRTREFDSDKQG